MIKDTTFSFLNGIESVKSSTSYEYDANGRKTREIFDNENDGKTDKFKIRKYNSNGDLAKELEDSNANGRIDKVVDHDRKEVRTFEYDAQGKKTKEKVHQDYPYGHSRDFEVLFDMNGNKFNITHNDYNLWEENELKSKFEFHSLDYDSNGNLIRDTTYTFLKGVDSGNRSFVSYDSKEKKIQETYTSNGAINAVLEFDAQGRKIKERKDRNKDGVLDTVIEFSADGRRIIESRDENNDGIFEVVYRNGAVAREFVDTNADGRIDEVVDYRYIHIRSDHFERQIKEENYGLIKIDQLRPIQ